MRGHTPSMVFKSLGLGFKLLLAMWDPMPQPLGCGISLRSKDLIETHLASNLMLNKLLVITLEHCGSLCPQTGPPKVS